jgi:hypothetical protein
MEIIIIIIIILYLIYCIYNIYYFINNYTLITSIPKPNKLSDLCIEQIITPIQAMMFADRIKNNKQLWQKQKIILHTIGTASYIEHSNGYNSYKKKYEITNKILEDNYSDLLDIILKYFQKRCPESNVKYRFAYPGFHIFDCNLISSLPVMSVHMDSQYELLQFNENENINSNDTLSFTLCLELPKSGGGLYIFESNLQSKLQSKLQSNDFFFGLPINSKKEKIEYKPGYIVCHNGKDIHMIAPSLSLYDNNYRITLQGHGVYEKSSNTWFLYW